MLRKGCRFYRNTHYVAFIAENVKMMIQSGNMQYIYEDFFVICKYIYNVFSSRYGKHIVIFEPMLTVLYIQ